MCMNCYNAEKKASSFRKCDGKRIPFATLKQVKEDTKRIFEATGKTSFRFFKDGIIDPPNETITLAMPLKKSIQISFI